MKTLVVGASKKKDRYSYIATNMLMEEGHEAYPFNPKADVADTFKILDDWPANGIDTVSLYIGAARQNEYYSKIIDLKPRRVIFNPGTENSEFEALLAENGIANERACTLVLLRTGQY